MIKCKSVFVLVLLLCPFQSQAVKLLNRQKRSLIFPQGGSKLLAIFGVGVPVDTKPETVIFGNVIKANYPYPTNATQLTDPLSYITRQKRALNRWNLYSLLAQAMEINGFQGKSCLLRTICEVARTPLVKNFGLFHEIIHAIFTPTSTTEKVRHNTDYEYHAAHQFGRQKESCESIFKDCTVDFVSVFTFLDEE